jgi:hypothetical protein
MNSVAVKENLLKQVVLGVINVFLTRFLGQTANDAVDDAPSKGASVVL